MRSFDRPRPRHGHLAGDAGFERIADLGNFLLPDSSELSGGKLLAMAVPLFSAVGMFDGWPLFAMPLSIAVPAFAKRALHRRAVVTMELAVAIPGLGALRRPLSGRAVLAMILAFFVAPFDGVVWPGLIRADARTGLYSLTLPEPPCRSLGPCG